MNLTPYVLAAYDAGLCTIPARADGSKAPAGEWKAWQTERPPRMQVAKWFATEHPGVGVVCGAVSGNLTMLELEGRAVALGLGQRLGAQCLAMGAADAWRAITTGWCEVTPSGGLHFYFRTLELAAPNTRLASTADHEVLVETRGQGGFSVIAPSYGPTHPTGKPWVILNGGYDTVPTLTAGQVETLFAACATFDEAAPFTPTAAPPRATKLSVPMWNGQALGASWMDDVDAHLGHTTTMPALLLEYGWRYDHDAGGRSYWTRPDKAAGVSATINESGRLVVFSTSTPFAPYDGAHAPSYGLLDVIAAYEHAGDREAAGRRIADEAGIFAARDGRAMAFLKAGVSEGNVVRLERVRGPHGPVGDETDDGGVLPPEFWTGHVGLEAIRAGALARMVAPTALMHVCLARVAAIAPFIIVIPPMIGGAVNLTYLTALVGAAETGKSATVSVASELFPAPSHVLDGLPPGSGEGLADVLFEYVTEDDPVSGKRLRVRRQTKHNAFVYVDEGQALNSLAARGSSTLLSTLRSAYSTQPLGNANAREETRRIVPAGHSVFGVVVSIQPSVLGPLFDAVDVGMPQRFAYADTTDTALGTVADNLTDVLTPIAWRPPTEGRRATLNGFSRLLLSYPLHVVAEVRERRAAIMSRALVPDPFDAHNKLTQLKISGLLAVMDGRTDVTEDDWQRGAMVMRCSEIVRDRARAVVMRDAERAEERHANKLGKRAATADRVVSLERVERAALAIARKVRLAQAMTVAELRRSFSSSSPHRAHLDDGLTAAVERGWITESAEAGTPVGGNDKRVLRPGGVTP